MSKPRENTARVDRRTTIKWLAATMAAVNAGCTVGQRSVGEEIPPKPAGRLLGVAEAADGVTIGTDPDLLNPLIPWARTMTDAQLDVATRLCDLILPSDDRSPAASALGVPDFIDEWVSAPYPDQQRDRKIVFDGLLWLQKQSLGQFDVGFADATNEQRSRLLDQIAFADKVGNGLQTQHQFFKVYRNLTMSAFYATEVGMADIGYIGNSPIVGEYPGPTPEALAHLEKALNSLGLEMPEA